MLNWTPTYRPGCYKAPNTAGLCYSDGKTPVHFYIDYDGERYIANGLPPLIPEGELSNLIFTTAKAAMEFCQSRNDAAVPA